ncbi:hypothetical protein StrepF001_07835 [Streptomyces sp. F001]|uniref:hypothetical protein n=1 Tax=Streptomyces sp. F001 TaxID=1510026 RepID=UPI00101E7CCE|nr:hypothetical protein [Streptomyces sp. F001]RZB18855.1 hypothetical protein StrepF001_07835 [Streptomyces sp. F001]
MVAPSPLRPEDRPDFEAVLHLALNTPDIRNTLRSDPTTTGPTAARLRTRALANADESTAAAQREYRTYLTLHTSAQPGTSRGHADGSLLPAVAVLTPPGAASSAAILLMLGYVFQLADIQGTLPGSLVTAGWVLALVAATSTLAALTALLTTAMRGRGGSVQPARLEQARLDWQRALLTHGMLPYLRRCIGEEPSVGPAAPTTQPPADPTAESNGSPAQAD